MTKNYQFFGKIPWVSSKTAGSSANCSPKHHQSRNWLSCLSNSVNYYTLLAILCLSLAASWQTTAQVNINQTFETSATPTGWAFGTGTLNQTYACGSYSWRKNIKASPAAATFGELRTPTWTSNGQNVNISFKYKVINWQGVNVAAPNYDGTITTTLSLNGGTTYPVTAGVINSSNHVTSNSCATVNYTVPAASVPAGSNIRMKIRLDFGATGDHYIYVDDVTITQLSGAAPVCAGLLSPSNGDSVSNDSETISWSAATDSPTSYDVYFGTSPNPTLVANQTSLSYRPDLEPSTTYYWKVVPKNAFGAASGCETRSFTTQSVLQCSPGVNNDNCSTAQTIYLGTTASTNGCATSSSVIASPSCAIGANNYYDTWYKFSTGTTSFVNLSLLPSVSVNAGFALYSGSCGSLTAVSNSCSATGSSTLITGLAANTIYYLRVFSTAKSSRGDFAINLVVPCTLPTGVVVTNTLNSASFRWTAATSLPMNGYEYEIRTSGAAGSGSNGLAASGSSLQLSKEVTGLLPNTNYTLYLRSACGTGDFSTWTSGTSFYTGFCLPAPSSGIGNGITRVAFDTVDNTTSAESGNYFDYTAMSGTVQRANPATVTVNLASAQHVKIWVDWNNDLDFSDSGEEVYATTTQSDSISAVFNVPVTTSIGNHRMRIGAGTSSSLLSDCYKGSAAAFEDYTLNVDSMGRVHLNDAACNSTVTSFTQGLYMNNIANAQSYRFRVRNGMSEQILTRNAPYITLNMLTAPEFGVTYVVDVAVMLDGSWTDYGKVCTVTTVSPVPLPRLEECVEGGASVASFSKAIYAKFVPGAVNYRFMVTSTQGTYTFDRPSRYFTINMLPSYDYNVNYTVRVATLTGSTWTQYGEPCVVTVDMPTVTIKGQYCNGTVSKRGTAIYANNYPGAITYHFRVTVGGNQFVVIRNVGYFFLSQVGTTIPMGTTVGVEVKVFTANAESDYGAVCNVTLSNAAGRPGSIGDTPEIDDNGVKRILSNLSGFPNPFNDTFSLDFVSENEEMVNIVVYDMTGKLVDRRSVSVNELTALKIGENFSTGIYNLILTHGETVKTLRVVKGN